MARAERSLQVIDIGEKLVVQRKQRITERDASGSAGPCDTVEITMSPCVLVMLSCVRRSPEAQQAEPPHQCTHETHVPVQAVAHSLA